MDEDEWLDGCSASAMVEFLADQADERRLRLFACNCCRLPAMAAALQTHGTFDFIETVERYADGRTAWTEVALCIAVLPRPRVSGGAWRSSKPAHLTRFGQALHAARSLGKPTGWEAAWGVVRDGVNLFGTAPCDLLRDIFGNPFRPVSTHPAWRSPTAAALAAGIYADRAFDRMPILADALEEAGCDNADVLAHCRGDGPHVRGCWVVDAVLGKV